MSFINDRFKFTRAIFEPLLFKITEKYWQKLVLMGSPLPLHLFVVHDNRKILAKVGPNGEPFAICL